ncbi:MAG: TRAM domain-containing protein, partial [Gammaproteobacteria bacterium]
QSGSDRILAAMKRGHTQADYRARIERLRHVRPDIALSSDFIVGFPGETDADFEDTMRLIEDLGFDNSFSFIFSARPGTPAATLPDPVPMAVKEARLARLQARIRVQADAIAAAMIGRSQRVLVMGSDKLGRGELSGRTENNRVVNFSGPARLIGGFAQVRIEAALTNSLRGTLLDGPPAAVMLHASVP